MSINPSSYSNPETRRFGTFYNDLSVEQQDLHYQTVQQLRSYGFDTAQANLLGNILGVIIDCGGIYQDNKEDSVWWRQGFYNSYLGEGNSTTQYCGELGVWYDPKKRLFNVLEWNKVRGIVVRSYAPMTFIKKLYKTFVFNGKNQPEIKPSDYQDVIDILFPDLSKMEVQVWDKPSKMYDHDNINSCMVGETYVKFYDTAPCKGLVVVMGDKLVTRCILWTLDDGRRIIGRIYDSTVGGTKLIKEWCKENNVLVDDWDGSCVVTSPISSYGVPYQDDLMYGVRMENELVMFTTAQAAKEYARNNKTDLLYDLCHTGGNVRELREPLVKCHDGTYDVRSNTIYQDGVYYNTASLRFARPHTLSRIPNSQMVYHPTIPNTVIAAGLLDVVNGEVVVRSECITLEDGQLAHPDQLYYSLEVVNGELVMGTTPILRPKSGVIVLGMYMYTTRLVKLGKYLGITPESAGRLVPNRADRAEIEEKIYNLE